MPTKAQLIATMGIGYGARAMVGIGFTLALASVEPSFVQSQPYNAGVGGGGYDKGQAYLKTEHGWVRLTSFKKIGASAFEASASVGASAEADIAPVKARSIPPIVNVQSIVNSDCVNANAISFSAKIGSKTTVDSEIAMAEAVAKPCRIDWLSADEIMIILEELQ